MPLNPNCRWRISEDRAYLDWNAGCIGYVVPQGERFLTVIQWQQRTHQAPCGSVAQGMRWIDRWMAHRGGLPGAGKVHWYDRRQPMTAQSHEALYGRHAY